MDLKKEIKLSDLFRRNGRDSGEDGVAETSAPKEPKQRRLFARAPKEAKEPKPPKNGKGRFDADAKNAPAVPPIPLMRAFDLLPKEHAGPAERRLGVAQIAVGLLGVVALGALGALFLMTDANVKEKRSERDALKTELAVLEAKIQADTPSTEPELETERVTRTNAVATALTSRVAWDRLLRDVALVLPGDVYLEAMTARSPVALADPPGSNTSDGSPVHFTITGRTHAQANVALTLARLSTVPELSNVRLVSSQQLALNDDFVFTINATVRHPGMTA